MTILYHRVDSVVFIEEDKIGSYPYYPGRSNDLPRFKVVKSAVNNKGEVSVDAFYPDMAIRVTDGSRVRGGFWGMSGWEPVHVRTDTHLAYQVDEHLFDKQEDATTYLVESGLFSAVEAQEYVDALPSLTKR